LVTFDGMNMRIFAQVREPDMPRVVSLIAKVASSEATIRSHSAAMCAPPPNA
jgi:hypothetical protein